MKESTRALQKFLISIQDLAAGLREVVETETLEHVAQAAEDAIIALNEEDD